MDQRQLLLGTFVLSMSISVAFAQSDRAAAETTAENFLRRLDSGDLPSLYQSVASPRFKKDFSQTAFVQSVGVMRIQTGGPASTRKLVGAQALDQLPGTDKGSFYYVRHYARFPATAAFQEVYLESVSGSWKVSGYWNLPAPPQ